MKDLHDYELFVEEGSVVRDHKQVYLVCKLPYCCFLPSSSLSYPESRLSLQQNFELIHLSH